MISFDDIHRLNLGYVLKPADATGTGHPQVVPILAYYIAHPDGGILFDAGVAPLDAGTEAYYRPYRVPLTEALEAAGQTLASVRVVVPCHLHFDHIGDLSQLIGRPVVVQRAELDAAREPGYTVPGIADDVAIGWETIDGEEELMEGVRIVPTPGHTAGHQSVIVRAREGAIVLAGQALDTASEWSAAYLNWAVSTQGAEGGDDLDLPYPAWLPHVQEFRPSVVLFAHDLPMWTTAM